MKKYTTVVLGGSAVALVVGAGLLAASAFAAGVTLTNGGLGQVATNHQQFGVAVCNGGKASVAQSVPVSISANGVTVSVASVAPIAAGQCAYTYVTYSGLNMAAGGTYSVSATIDPNHTVITNSNNQASYTVAVPAASVAAQTSGAGQSGNFLAVIGTAFSNFFSGITRMFQGK